ncbi:hypothetical protein IQ06DRAFT_298212 [Phaeosphaeriaceae sp. SRC1lsM3a]|nr:hypothetical protein IQ06DRAFT_298212 [Stagonospora sp. SRC1lsM3a]
MPQSKALPKERYNRQRRARSIRRSLAQITPATSHPQLQCHLFSALPAEIRFLIFQHVLSQVPDPSHTIDIHSISPLYRSSHTQHTTISTALLRTCRLIYYEAHKIPLRSATHHFRYLGSTSWLYTDDLWLHHMTSQRGADVYHLHDNLVALSASNFNKFLLPHLLWKRISWTVCAYMWPPLLAGHHEIERLAETLENVVLPASCREVTLEMETRQDLGGRWGELMEQAVKCRTLDLVRRDGEKLVFDDKLAVHYTWVGSGQARWGTSVDAREMRRIDYHTVRLCWRTGGSRRDYTSYDRLDCLRLEGCPEVKKIMPLQWDNKEFV